ncbi:TPA: hypothetical protein HA246_01340 [Candidatus Woesearchaeota archaeon]|nr:hypothetical protein [Candidatus Woesearchaeota archaeon]
MENKKIIKNIGKIQLVIGIIILLSSVIGSYLIFKNFYVETLTGNTKALTDTWTGEIKDRPDNDIGVTGHVATSIILNGLILKTNFVVFVVGIIILVVLSLTLILQGLVNIYKE